MLVSGKKYLGLDRGRDLICSALLGRPMPMHSRKKLQKKETSTLIPKKYFEFEVSSGGVGEWLLGEVH